MVKSKDWIYLLGSIIQHAKIDEQSCPDTGQQQAQVKDVWEKELGEASLENLPTQAQGQEAQWFHSGGKTDRKLGSCYKVTKTFKTVYLREKSWWKERSRGQLGVPLRLLNTCDEDESGKTQHQQTEEHA